MYTNSGLVINGTTNSTGNSDNDNAAISIGLLAPGLIIVLMNCIVLIGSYTKLRQEPEEWFRLMGLSTCDLFCGIVAIFISALTFHSISAVSCKIIHILIPTICCSQLFYLLAVFLYDDLVLKDTAQNTKHNNGIFLFVFVFVSWFMSFVFCSLPVVADTRLTDYTGNCSPEVLFGQTWRQAMVFYTAIYFLPLLATNMFFVKLVIDLRKMHTKENSPYVQSIEVAPCHSRSNADHIQEVQGSNISTRNIQITQDSVSTKSRSTVQQTKALQNIVQSSPGKAGNASPGVKKKRPTFKKGKEDMRLWKKLQETVFNQSLKQTGSFAERYRQAVQANQSSSIRRTTVTDSKKSVVIQPERETGIPLSVLQRRLVTLAILLAILDGVSIFRLTVLVDKFSGKAETIDIIILTIVSVTVGTLLNGIVHALTIYNINEPISILCTQCKPRENAS